MAAIKRIEIMLLFGRLIVGMLFIVVAFYTSAMSY
jgi:hypothetical protein